MSDHVDDRQQRLLELMADQALTGLPEDQMSELRTLIAAMPDLADQSMELAAAAVDQAIIGAALEPMPADARRRLDEVAQSWIDRQAGRFGNASQTAPAQAPWERRAPQPRSIGWVQWTGWLAAAACLVLAAVAWLQQPAREPSPTLAARRQSLLAAADVQTVSWQATEDPLVKDQPLSGDVVWSNDRQQGFMRFSGLPANIPSENQYQLWIFDENQDERFPIDGGVFDIAAGQDEVIVPIDSKLQVTKPTLFAITVEKPGGVVVSSRERLVAIAKTS